jgi:putative SOS response-associated peptidase YedK
MCGAYGFSVKDAREVYNRFDIENTLEHFAPRYNIRPGQMNPVITSHSPNHISLMFWGLIPHFAKDLNYKYKTINARAETVANLPSFRGPLKRSRCLVPATGFYEPDKVSKTSPPFTWHFFHPTDQSIFAFAGLFDIWEDKTTGNTIQSYTIITTVPNEIVGKFHDRMPAIVRREDEEDWLNPDIVEPERLLILLKPYPSEHMEEWQVGDSARNPRNDNPDVCKPV